MMNSLGRSMTRWSRLPEMYAAAGAFTWNTDTPAKTLDNMRVNLARGLKPLGPCKPHGEVVSIAAGRPSLADTFGEMQGHVAAGNGSLGYLIERGVVPHFCVVIDAMPHMAEIVVPDNGVYYLLSTSCDPGLFDKLLKADCKIRIWNPLPANVGVGIDETSFQMREGGKGFRLLGEDYPDQFMIGGGTSVGLRTIFLGYVLGYRTFHLHGNDASFRGLETHAHWDRRWGDWVERSSIEIKATRPRSTSSSTSPRSPTSCP